MSAKSITYPKDTIERLKIISKETGIPLIKIKAEYDEMFMDEFIQNDPQFRNDEERHYTATMFIWSRYKARKPTQKPAKSLDNDVVVFPSLEESSSLPDDSLKCKDCSLFGIECQGSPTKSATLENGKLCGRFRVGRR